MKRILLIVAFAGVLFGCDGKISKNLTSEHSKESKGIPATPTPVELFSLMGEAELKMRVGSDKLTGMRVFLVDTNQFRNEMAKMDKEMKCQEIIDNIGDVAAQEVENEKARRYRTSLVEAKQKEIQTMRAQKWSSFVYIDPITDQSRKITMDPLGNPASVDAQAAYMQRRINALKALLPQYDTISTSYNDQMEGLDEKLVQFAPEYSGKSLSELLSEYKKKNSSYWGEELLSAIGKCSVDDCIVDKEGQFVFHDVTRKDYFVVAFYDADGIVTWATPVKWYRQGPGKIVLSSQNTLDLSQSNKIKNYMTIGN